MKKLEKFIKRKVEDEFSNWKLESFPLGDVTVDNVVKLEFIR
jgi:hypothetical protein